MPVPIGFDSTSTSPGRRAALREDAIGVDQALHGEAEDRLLAADGVAADDRAARRPDHFGRGAKHGLDRLERQPLGEGRDVQRDRHPAAHGEHVAARVGRGDGAEVGRVVDERREEVGRGHHREVVADPVDGGVVERRQADEERGVGRPARSRTRPESGAPPTWRRSHRRTSTR